MEPAQGNAREVRVRSISIVVDDREAQSGVLPLLRIMPEFTVRVQRLKSGDYFVAERCLIERKTLTDFAASIVDGRLFCQSRRLAGPSQISALILEGTSRDLEKIQVSREAMQGAMVSLALIYQLPVLRSMGPSETARLLLYAGRQSLRSSQTWFLRAGRRARTRRGRQLRILRALPGVGPERAALLLETFGAVRAVVDANPDELERVIGIGPKTAAGIVEVLR